MVAEFPIVTKTRFKIPIAPPIGLFGIAQPFVLSVYPVNDGFVISRIFDIQIGILQFRLVVRSVRFDRTVTLLQERVRSIIGTFNLYG